MIPRSTHTLAPKGSRQVPGLVKKALAQITKVTAISLLGVLLAYQLIFGGKTSAVFPDEVKPAPGSFYSATPSHFANASTTLEFVQKIIVPFVEANRCRRIEQGKSTKDQEERRWAIIIWDNFSAHKDVNVEECLNANRIKSMFLPPNCTSIYQALNVMFNGNEKQVLRNHFSEWHFSALQRAIAKDPTAIDVLPKTAAKKRALIATLIRGVHEIMEQKKDLICRAWAKTGLYDVPDVATPEEVIGTDDVLVREMVRLTIDKDEEVELMDVDEELDIMPADVDVPPPEYSIHDLDDTNFEKVDEPAVNPDDLSDDDDYDSWSDQRKRILGMNDVAAMEEAASTSAESSHRVNVERVKQGGALRISFTGQSKPRPEELLTILKAQGKVTDDTTIVATTNSDAFGYNITLSGIRSSTFAQEHGSIIWFD